MNKLYPDNPHHDNYSESLGWEYLGSDERYDYYVNHNCEFLSIVYGNEGYEYLSPMYSLFKSSKFLEHAFGQPAYLTLKELLTNQQRGTA